MWPAPEPWFWPVAVMAAGWVWGSFLNQLVDRTPRRSAQPRPAGSEHWPGGPPALLRPLRSVCFSCRAPIPWFENVPVVSYLWLRGRCRRCGAAIGLRTLLMEAAAPLGFLALALLFPVLGPAGGLGGAGPWEFPPWGFLLWGCLLYSWALVAGALLFERRRFSIPFLAAGVCVCAGWGLALT